MSVQIRSYQPADWPAVQAVFLQNTPRFFAKAELNDLKAYLQEYADTYFVIVQAKKIVGAGGYRFPTAESGQLQWDFLSPEVHGQGLGRKLIEHCLDALQSNQQLKSLEVWTSQLAEPFYAKFGFVTEKIEPDYWAKNLDLYLMKKSLSENE